MKDLIPSQQSQKLLYPFGKTDHAVAVAYMQKGWGKHKSRADWENSLRFNGVMKLPETISALRYSEGLSERSSVCAIGSSEDAGAIS